MAMLLDTTQAPAIPAPALGELSPHVMQLLTAVVHSINTTLLSPV